MSARSLRIAISGCGMRSRTVWQRHVDEDPALELVGVQDVAESSLEKAYELGRITPGQGFLELERMLAETTPDALIVAPVHSAHAAAIGAGLEAGCHILVEKPFATSLDAAIRLTTRAEELGLVLAVVQNWRTKSVGVALRAAVEEGLVGPVSHLLFRYLRDRELAHLPEYLFAEEDPMLYALTVHHVDLYRYVLGQEIAMVEARSFHPPWSRYRGDSLVQLWMETDGGVAISYAGTISSRQSSLPFENLVIEGERGSLVNDSNFLDPPLLLYRRGESEPVDLTADAPTRGPSDQYELADRAILGNFRDAVLRGAEPISPARENLGTVAALDAIRDALHSGRPVELEPLAAAPPAV
jgi:predicted dehydrogenase